MPARISSSKSFSEGKNRFQIPYKLFITVINSLHVSFLQNYGKLKNNQRKIQSIIIILTMHPLKNPWCILSIQKISLVTISLFTLHDLKFHENYAIHQFKACWNVTEQTVNTWFIFTIHYARFRPSYIWGRSNFNLVLINTDSLTYKRIKKLHTSQEKVNWNLICSPPSCFMILERNPSILRDVRTQKNKTTAGIEMAPLARWYLGGVDVMNDLSRSSVGERRYR